MILEEKNQTSTALVWFFSKCDYYQYVTISLKLTIRDAKGITMLKVAILVTSVKPTLALLRSAMCKTIRNGSAIRFLLAEYHPQLRELLPLLPQYLLFPKGLALEHN